MGQQWDIQTQAEFYEWLDKCPVQYQRRMNLQGEPSYVFFNHRKGKYHLAYINRRGGRCADTTR